MTGLAADPGPGAQPDPAAATAPGSPSSTGDGVGAEGNGDGAGAGGTALLEALRGFEGQPAAPVVEAPDPVNPAMIRHWCEALGDRDPRYEPGPDQVAPPAMLQAWCMRGLAPPPADTAQSRLRTLLREAGYVGVVATNSTQTYARDLRPGDHLREERVIESVSDPKQTALGEGFFVTTRSRFLDAAGELVAEMTFRVLYFRPAVRSTVPPSGEPSGPSEAPARAEAPAPSRDSAAPKAPAPADEPTPPVARRPRPSINQDNEFFFAGARDGRLLIQRCEGCDILQHPPTPVCPECGSFDRGVVEPSGRGEVHSFVVNHHPQVPGFDYPLVVALVELEEGVRLVTNLVGIDPADVRIGLPVRAELVAVDDDLTLPMFRPAETPAEPPAETEVRSWTSP